MTGETGRTDRRGPGRTLLLLALAGACLLVVSLVAVRAGLFRDALRSRVEGLLSSALDQPVSVGELAGPLWPGFELREVRVGSEGDQGETAGAQVDVPSVRVVVGRPILSPPFGWTIESIEIDRPVLRGAWQDREGDGEERGASPPDPEGAPAPRVRIRDLKIAEALLEARVAEQGSVTLVGNAAFRDLDLDRGLAGLADGSGELRLDVVETASGPAVLDEGQLRARLAEGRLHLDELVSRGKAGQIAARGALDAAGWASGDPTAELRLELELEAVDLAALTGRSELASKLAGRGELWLRGPGPDLLPDRGRLEIAIQPSASPVGALEAGNVRLLWQDGVLDLEALEVRGEGLELAARGRHADGRVHDLRVDARFEDLGTLAAALAPGEKLSGSIEGHAELAGPIDRLTGGLSLDGSDVAWRGAVWSRIAAELLAEADAGFRIDQLRFDGQPQIEAKSGGRIRVVEGHWELQDIELRAEGALITVQGGADAEGLRGLALRVADFDLGLLRDRGLVPAGLEGILAADLQLDGPYAAPRASGDLSWSGALDGAPPDTDLRLSIAASGALHRIEGEARSAGRSWLRGHATLPQRIPETGLAGLLADLHFAADVDDLPLAWLLPFAPEWVGALDGRVAGHCEGSFQAGDPVPVLTGQLSLADAELAFASTRSRVRIPRAELVLDGRSLVVDDTLVDWIDDESARQARLRVEGGLSRLGFSRAFRLRTEGLDAALLGSIASLAAPISGPIDADLRLSGVFGAPSFEGHVIWRDPVLGQVRGDRLQVDASSTGGPVEVTGELRIGGATVLALEGRTPRASELEIEDWSRLLRKEGVVFKLRAEEVDLRVLSPWVRGLAREPAGEATGFIEIIGATEGARLAGELDLRAGSLRVPALATTFAPISGRLSLDTTALHLRDLRIGEDAGGARVSGRIEHRALRPTEVELGLVADRFRLARRGLFETEVTAHATLEGPWSAPAFEGEARLDGLDVQVPRLEDPSMSEIRIVNPGEEALPPAPDAGAGGPAEPDVALQVHVGIPAGGRIRGLGADLEVEGDVTITRQPGQPIAYAGELRVIRGTYLLQGRRFEVTRGIATLDGSPEPDPLLDVEASRPIRDVTIIARLSGPLSDPIVTLTSEPPMPEDEVVAYVLFGRPASQLTASGQAFVGGAAGQLASGLATSRFGELTQRFLRVDTIDVDTNGGTPVLGIGKTLNERTFVRIGKSLEIPAEDEIQVEVKLTPQISVQSEITTEGNAGADVLWKLDY